MIVNDSTENGKEKTMKRKLRLKASKENNGKNKMM